MRRFIFLALGILASCKGVDQVGNAFGVVAGGGSGGGFEVTLLTLNPTAYDFGAVTLNATSTKTILVSNSGQTPITLGSIALSGNAAFSQTNNCGASIAVGQSCSVTATFTPTSSVTVSTILSIEYNDGAQKATSLLGQGGSSLVFNGIDTVTNVGAKSAKLNWTGATGGSVSAYQVQRLEGSSWNVKATLDNTKTHYVDATLSPATTYSWRVYALDSFGVPDGNTTVRTALTSVVAFDDLDPSDLSVAENATTTATLSCSDNVGNTPVYSLVGQTDTDAGCSVVGSTFSCTPAIKSSHVTWTSTVDLRCVIDGVTLDKSVVLTVTDSTRPPILTVPSDRAFPNHLPVGTALSLTSSATDADGDTLTFACSVRSTNLSPADPSYMAPGSNCNSLPAIQGGTASFNATTGVLSWTPSTTQFATYEFDITVSDGFGGTDSDSFSVTSAQPAHRGVTPFVYLDSIFATGSGPAITTQATSWTDLSGNAYSGSIVGTGDNVGDHWKGDGTYTDPYRLALDGVNDYLELNANNVSAPSAFRYHTLRFRIPSSATDGFHPVVSLDNRGVIGVVKGAGENHITIGAYSGGATVDMAGTFQYDKWYTLYFLATNDGRILIFYSGLFAGHLGYGSDIRLDTPSQAGVGTNQYYVGYKPSAVGPGSGAFAQGTALYGNVEIVSLKIDSGLAWYDFLQDDYFFHERVKHYPLGDTRISSLAVVLDPATAGDFGYDAYDSALNCADTLFNFTPTGASLAVASGDNLQRYDANVGGVSNPGCLSTESGFQGTGATSDPHRWASDGTNDYFVWNRYTGITGGFVDPTTKANSFDLWVRLPNSGNSVQWNGFGPVLFAHAGEAWVTQSQLLALNNGDGTSEIQFRSFSTSGATMDVQVQDTGITVVNGSWNHIGVTMSGAGQFRIYKNGVLVYTSSSGALTLHPLTQTLTSAGAWQAMTMGYAYTNHGGAYVQVFSKADFGPLRIYAGDELSASEVLYNCNHDKARFQGATCGP